MNSFNYGRTRTLDIGAKTDNKVFIKIPLESGGFWQKEYFQNDLIETVIKDFKAENHVDIPQDYFMDWNFKNKSLKMTDQIKTLLNQEIPTVCINQVIKKKPLKINNEDIIADLVGKPFNDPFEVFLFTKEDKSLKIQTYDPVTVNNLFLNNYSPSSSYCNGNNHLFISGGEKKDGEIIDNFWEIDLKLQNIAEPVKIPRKKNHSMIFIPNNYVFIVGGNDKKTFYFNTENAEVCDWAELNKIRNEPALQRINNNLYCFDSINGNNEMFSLEKTDLSSNKPEWVLLTPKFDFPINNEQNLSQKFFGVSKDDEDNIIFLGGNMDNDSNNYDEIFNYKYNTRLNDIEVSKVPYRKYNFKEKTFLTYKKNIDYILPDFNKQHPEVVFFVKKNNKIEAIDYEPKFNSQLKSLKPPISDFKYDFNMPNITIPDQITDFNIDQQNQIKTEQNMLNTNLKMNINEPSFQDLNYKNQNDNNDLKNEDINPNKKDFQINFKDPENVSNQEELKINMKMNPDIVKNKEQIYLRNIEKNNNINSISNQNNEITIQTGNLNVISQEPNINFEKNIQIEDPIKNIPKIQLNEIITSENKNTIDGNNNEIDIKAPKLEGKDENIKITKNIDSSINGVISGTGIPKNDIEFNNITEIDFTKDVDIRGIILGINARKNINSSTQKKNKNNINLNGNIKGIKTNETKTNIKNPNTYVSQNINIDLKEQTLNPNNLNNNILVINANEPKKNVESLNLKQNNINYNISGNIPGKALNPLNTNINLKSQSNYNKNNDLQDKKTENQKINIPSKKIEITTKQKIPDYNLNGNIPGTNNNINLKKNNKNTNKNTNKKIEQNVYLSGIIKGTKSNKKKPTNINNNANTNKKADYNSYGNIPGQETKNQNIILPKKNINLDENKDINLTGTINGIKANIPKTDIPEGNINLKGPKVNVNVPSLNLSENIPAINSSLPKANLNQNNINVKEEKKINIPNYNNNINGILLEDKIKTQKKDLNEPNLEIHGPKIDTNNIINHNTENNNNNNEINLPKVGLNPPQIEIKSQN